MDMIKVRQYVGDACSYLQLTMLIYISLVLASSVKQSHDWKSTMWFEIDRQKAIIRTRFIFTRHFILFTRKYKIILLFIAEGKM